MVKEIVKDADRLSEGCSVVNFDLDDYMQIISDLNDTADAHSQTCAGLCANQIGYNKRIILINSGTRQIMINPEILGHSTKTFIATEGCLSLDYTSTVMRYKDIKVKYYDIEGNSHIKNFSNFVGQIIQHEIDHCNGKLI